MKIGENILNFVYLTIFSVSCIKDDTAGLQGIDERFYPIAIKFVNEVGSDISDTDCIFPDNKYAVQIEVSKNNYRNTSVSKIEYTINGAAYNMSFSEEGVKRNPVTLVDGKNSAELVKSAESTELIILKQDDFQLVE